MDELLVELQKLLLQPFVGRIILPVVFRSVGLDYLSYVVGERKRRGWSREISRESLGELFGRPEERLDQSVFCLVQGFWPVIDSAWIDAGQPTPLLASATYHESRLSTYAVVAIASDVTET